MATYNLVFNGAVMARAGMGYGIVLDKLVDTGPESDLIFRPLTDVPQTDIFVIWRKYQTFTPIAELLLQELQNRFNL
jgi:DNA-binding transcriptional LysR family regulator